MAKLFITAGTTSVSLDVFIQASTSTSGAGLTGLLGTSAGLTAYYHRPGGTAVPITLTTGSLTQAYTSGLFVEINATAMNGWYRFDPPDAALGTGAICVGMHLQGAASMAPLPLEVQLTRFDVQSPTVVLAPQVHTAAVIPVVQTASVALVANNVGTATSVLLVDTVRTATLSGSVHTGAIIPQVQTASLAMLVSTASAVLTVDTVRTATLAPAVHTGAIIPIVQTASNLGGTVVLAPQTHTSAVIPVVQTASNLVNGITGTATVILAAGTHTGAVIPVVQTASMVILAQTVNTSSDGRMANLDLNIGAVQTSVATRAAPGSEMNITGTGMVNIANAIGTTTRPEAYRGSGAAGTPDQLMYELAQGLGGFSLTSTGTVASKNVFKADGTSSAQRFTLQLDTATQPTGIARA